MIDDAFFAFQVRRADFDKILLDHSEDCGAVVWQETRVTDVTQFGGRVTGLRWRGPNGTEGKLLSRYILDCSGQSSLLGTRFNLREFNEEMRHVSLSGYYRGARKLSEVYPDLTLNNDGNLHIVSSAAGWFWHIPLADEISSVGFVTDPSHVRGMNPEQRVEFFLENVAVTPELLRLVEPAEWISDRVEMDSDWSFFCKSFHGPGYMLCGDAACFVDPVLSTGIALAMNGAIFAALTLTAALRQPELEPLAMHWYHGERNRDDWFWQARRIVDPSQSFSLQQAFSLIAAGVSRSPGATSHLKLKHAGGFSPEQLKIIYQNFELELSDEQQEQLEDFLEEERQARDYQPVTVEQMLGGVPRWIEGVQWQPYMLNDQEDVLRPATLVEIPDGDNTKTHFQSIAATSLLRLLDGSRTGQQIVDDAVDTWGAAVGKSATAVRSLVTDTLQELHEEGALIVA